MPPTFGISHDLRRPTSDPTPLTDYYAQCLTEISEADRLGFDTVWLSEHHFTDDGMLPSSLVAAAAIAPRTERIGIGTNILVLPLHHPLRVAEDAAVVDLLSGGRLTLAVGQSYAAAEFAGLGVDRRERASRLEEGIAVLRQAWDEPAVHHAGRHWRFDGVPVRPQPQRRIPLLVGAVAERAVERAVRLGDGLIVYCGKPADVPARRQLLDRALANHPRVEFPLVLTGILHVAPDADQAWAEAAPGIAQRLIALHRETRFDHFAHWARLPGLPHERAIETLRLVAEQVLPVVQRVTTR